jgi:GT2 family glycosyltransferase
VAASILRHSHTAYQLSPLLSRASPLSRTSQPSTEKDPAAPPTFSVVVPTHDRPDALERCIEALARQTYPLRDFEVIVCDDGSAFPVAPSVSARERRLRLTVIRQANAGPAAARNAGAGRARGRFLAFTDDDCVPAPDWLARLAMRFSQEPSLLLGGAVVNALDDDPYATTTQLIQTFRYEYYERHTAARRLFSTSNLAVATDRFAQLGGFSETFDRAAGEDYDFCDRWLHAGLGTALAPEAVVRHSHALSLPAFCRQHFGYGRALLRVRQRMARRAGARLKSEALGFYVSLVLYPLRRKLGVRGWLCAALVALSQAMTLAGAVREALATERMDATENEPLSPTVPGSVVTPRT